jgi:hypothetical protein
VSKSYALWPACVPRPKKQLPCVRVYSGKLQSRHGSCGGLWIEVEGVGASPMVSEDLIIRFFRHYRLDAVKVFEQCDSHEFRLAVLMAMSNAFTVPIGFTSEDAQ